MTPTPGDILAGRRGAWFRGVFYPCAIGRGGIVPPGAKREGDGATPAGVHAIVGMLYRPDRVAAHLLPGWARPIGPGDLWSDDSADAAYNRPVRVPYPHSHEAMRRADPLYDIVLVTGWNLAAPEPGRGSCIFVHVWRGPRAPTAGCVAFRRDHMLAIARRLQPGARLIVER